MAIYIPPIDKAVEAPPIPKAYKLFKYKGVLYNDFLDCCYQPQQDDPDFIKQDGIYIGFATKAEYYKCIADHAAQPVANNKIKTEEQAKKPVRFLNKEPALSQS